MPALHSAPINPSLCPVCDQPNLCAMEAAKASGASASTCWCVQATFSAALLARVPAQAQGKACICQRCAQASPRPTSSPHV